MRCRRILRWRGAGPSLATLVLALVAGCRATGAPPAGGEPFQRHANAATEPQRRYFADGEIDFSDYQEAVFATIACVKQRGYVARSELGADGAYMFVIRAASDRATGSTDDALDSCRDQWSKEVEGAYLEGLFPPGVDGRAIEATIRCLRSAGVPPVLGSAPEQLSAFIDQLPSESPGRACADLLP